MLDGEINQSIFYTVDLILIKLTLGLCGHIQRKGDGFRPAKANSAGLPKCISNSSAYASRGLNPKGFALPNSLSNFIVIAALNDYLKAPRAFLDINRLNMAYLHEA